MLAVMDATFLQNLLPPGLEFQCTQCEIDGNGIRVEGAFLASSAVCPECGHTSERVHGEYMRRVQDLPFGKTAVAYVITVRKFVCQNQSCTRSIFCERLSGLAAPHARTTESLSQSHQAIGFALGGEAGARLAEHSACPPVPTHYCGAFAAPSLKLLLLRALSASTIGRARRDKATARS